jgi:hypothetical protein
VSKHPSTASHNYEPKVLAIAAKLPAKSIADIDVRHDDWCDALNGLGFCNCDPVVKLRETKS